VKYEKFWTKFKEWALTTDDDTVSHRLKNIIEVVRENPDISIVKLAGYLDTDAVYLARYLRTSYKNATENQT